MADNRTSFILVQRVFMNKSQQNESSGQTVSKKAIDNHVCIVVFNNEQKSVPAIEEKGCLNQMVHHRHRMQLDVHLNKPLVFVAIIDLEVLKQGKCQND